MVSYWFAYKHGVILLEFPNIYLKFQLQQHGSCGGINLKKYCHLLDKSSISSVTFPLDLVRRRMQLEGAGGRPNVYNTGLFGTFRHIVKNEGLRGLYRGILPEYYKVVPSIGIVFMTYEKLKQLLSDTDG